MISQKNDESAPSHVALPLPSGRRDGQSLTLCDRAAREKRHNSPTSETTNNVIWAVMNDGVDKEIHQALWDPRAPGRAGGRDDHGGGGRTRGHCRGVPQEYYRCDLNRGGRIDPANPNCCWNPVAAPKASSKEDATRGVDRYGRYVLSAP